MEKKEEIISECYQIARIWAVGIENKNRLASQIQSYADQFASLQTAEVRKEREWISIEEMLPEKSGQVLGVREKR